MNEKERAILTKLDVALRRDEVRAAIRPIVHRVSKSLGQDRGASMRWEPIPLSIFGDTLPAGILSSWVFIIRAGAKTGAERHPNSHQRLMSFQERGDLPTQERGKWQSNPLVSDPASPLERRWISIPRNIWHEVIVPKEADWAVVSFHTVPAEELIEERPDSQQTGRTRQMRYLDKGETRKSEKRE